ncbi:MAG: hypothetical protein TR69_WS6001000381 [candidate division WS6 bacterium OLB20]|uniref:DUF11 domain-containing protein n=1 Tax=candidate division WS6 bacterium OLB20 TaxID=1617426 RepID=A0A136LXI9_9BACT|nr:MAG: hypothetical protein TR69_WS6001000381 [candidate division WS6 bacterium OLB20]
MSRPVKILLAAAGCVIAVAICCIAAIGGGVLLFNEAYKTDDRISISVETPERITEGDEFEFRMVVTNSGDSDLTITEMDISESLLEGTDVISVDPEPVSSSSFTVIEEYLEYTFDPFTIRPGESRAVTLTLKAEFDGLYRGDITFYNDRLFNQQEYHTSFRIHPEE